MASLLERVQNVFDNHQERERAKVRQEGYPMVGSYSAARRTNSMVTPSSLSSGNSAIPAFEPVAASSSLPITPNIITPVYTRVGESSTRLGLL
jgi:hypothetical protein